MGRSRPKIPAFKAGTARNINTITKLAERAAELGCSAGSTKKPRLDRLRRRRTRAQPAW
jgi:hypothetical protein